MSALANNIDSLIARGKYVSVDAERVFKKLTAIYCIVTLINGVYFLVWSYFASYNGVNFVGYKGYKSRAWEPDPVAEVTERNGLFYKGGLVYTKVYYSSATYGLQRTFLIAQWYGIVVSLSQFAACRSCERTSEKKTSRTHVLVRGVLTGYYSSLQSPTPSLHASNRFGSTFRPDCRAFIRMTNGTLTETGTFKVFYKQRLK